MKKVKWEGLVEVYVSPIEKVLQPGETVEVEAELAEELAARDDWSLVKPSKKKSAPREEPEAESAAEDAAEEEAE